MEAPSSKTRYRDAWVHRSSWAGPAAVMTLILGALPPTLLAQDGIEFRGQIVDATSGFPVSNALVSLIGHGAVLTSEQGRFRFVVDEPGDYTLVVEALGYSRLELPVSLSSDVDLSLPVEPAPLLLDTIVVELETLDFDGRVRDPRLEARVYDAHVRSDQGHDEWTSLTGRFNLDDVYENVPLRMMVNGFGYMPLDTTFIPDDRERYVFDLLPDPVGQRMIEVQTLRLSERTRSGRWYRPHRSLRSEVSREDMARSVSDGSLQTVLEATYPLHVLRRVSCFLIDERPTNSRAERTAVLQGTLVQELERIELLEFPGQNGALMFCVYRRRFFQELVATNRELRTPLLITFTRTCR